MQMHESGAPQHIQPPALTKYKGSESVRIQRKKRVAIVGAGTVGLSMAKRLSESQSFQDEEISISIIAETFLHQTTSYNCGGLWEPYNCGSTPDSHIRKWGSVAFDHFMSLMTDPATSGAGVQLLTAYFLFENDEKWDIPSWHDIVLNFHVFTAAEIDMLQVPAKYTSGFSFATVVVDQSHYMPFLTGKLNSLPVGTFGFQQRRLHSIDELTASGLYDVVINCSGLGAGELMKDPEVHPIRGQVLRVR
jgi:D-amino-acid oxidase